MKRFRGPGGGKKLPRVDAGSVGKVRRQGMSGGLEDMSKEKGKQVRKERSMLEVRGHVTIL